MIISIELKILFFCIIAYWLVCVWLMQMKMFYINLPIKLSLLNQYVLYYIYLYLFYNLLF